MSQNYYEVLGVGQNANSDEIRKAYYRLSKVYHPDKNAGDLDKSKKFLEIVTAYETLSDNEKNVIMISL